MYKKNDKINYTAVLNPQQPNVKWLRPAVSPKNALYTLNTVVTSDVNARIRIYYMCVCVCVWLFTRSSVHFACIHSCQSACFWGTDSWNLSSILSLVHMKVRILCRQEHAKEFLIRTDEIVLMWCQMPWKLKSDNVRWLNFALQLCWHVMQARKFIDNSNFN